MEYLLGKIESQLHDLPVSVALRLPAGRELGSPSAAVRLSFSTWSSLATMAAGRIGVMAEDFVECRLQLEGRMRELMLVAAGLLAATPAGQDHGRWRKLLRRLRSKSAHSAQRDAKQIEFHYDVSDDFYALWLDPQRVYSCAYYREPGLTLAQAQQAKLDLICRKLALQPGEKFLDIGAGWGALLLWAAEHYGVEATGITLSKNQYTYVQQQIAAKGLGDRVHMRLCDYRDLDDGQSFDKIASVGMFEHVGRANMATYFDKIARLLKPGGLVLNHGITAGGIEYDQLGAGIGDFIEKYIFPGGELLHVSQVLHDMAGAGLEMVDTENLRPHYERTLWAWSDALEAQLGKAEQVLTADGDLARGQKILRAYRLYLAGSAMSFAQGWIALHQILAMRPVTYRTAGALPVGPSNYPFNRDYMYRSAAI